MQDEVYRNAQIRNKIINARNSHYAEFILQSTQSIVPVVSYDNTF